MGPRVAGRVQLQVTGAHGRVQSHSQPCTPGRQHAQRRQHHLPAPGQTGLRRQGRCLQEPRSAPARHRPALPGGLSLSAYVSHSSTQLATS